MFLVHSTFREPEGMSSDEITERNQRESDAATALQREGVLLQLWREVGTRNAWGVWNAASDERLAEVLAALPWSTQMTFESFPITVHPNALLRDVEDAGAPHEKVSG